MGIAAKARQEVVLVIVAALAVAGIVGSVAVSSSYFREHTDAEVRVLPSALLTLVEQPGGNWLVSHLVPQDL